MESVNPSSLLVNMILKKSKSNFKSYQDLKDIFTFWKSDGKNEKGISIIILK